MKCKGNSAANVKANMPPYAMPCGIKSSKTSLIRTKLLDISILGGIITLTIT
jgi:hypothetical protein